MRLIVKKKSQGGFKAENWENQCFINVLWELEKLKRNLKVKEMIGYENENVIGSGRNLGQGRFKAENNKKERFKVSYGWRKRGRRWKK